ADLHHAQDWRAQDPEGADQALEYGIHSLITVPLRARGVVLGMVNFWRGTGSLPFEEEDVAVAEELVARAAVAIDNARRYAREHALAVTLQRSLLPRDVPDQEALEIAWRYLPARAGVGGDWFDVIPLPGFRVALVVGDIVGHGLHAAVTMGRLRTAVLNFSSLDLSPDELLSHLDEMVTLLDTQASNAHSDGAPVTGATCLYAIYDPVGGHCTLSRAGHVAPAVVDPQGGVTFPDLPLSPPLGVGGHPFETGELDLPEGSRLVLFTDGLVEDRGRDIDEGLRMLRSAVADPDRTPEETCRAVMESMLPDRPSDDVALLVARTRLLDPARVAAWDVPFDVTAVSRVRTEVSRRLADWGLEKSSFTTELVLSELLTNAIRYGAPPVRVRMLLGSTLVLEVSDGSNTSPRLRRAATTDEGGRGLFLVSQFADRWGTRYAVKGKVIWAEQTLGRTPEPDTTALIDELAW
ncbi:ATP-binding SpoIIE family protein phosphatase, partial [Streptomyces pharetrae]